MARGAIARALQMMLNRGATQPSACVAGSAGECARATRPLLREHQRGRRQIHGRRDHAAGKSTGGLIDLKLGDVLGRLVANI